MTQPGTDAKLTSQVQRDTFAYFVAYRASSGACPSAGQVARHFKLHRQTALDRLNRLVGAGLLRKVGRHFALASECPTCGNALCNPDARLALS